MSKRTHRPYSEEFKRNALELAETSGKRVNQIEQDLGLSAGLLHKWRERYQVESAAGGIEKSAVEALRAEVRRLQRENKVLAQERDILKKAVSIFSKDQPA